jgi:hypothetical protein
MTDAVGCKFFLMDKITIISLFTPRMGETRQAGGLHLDIGRHKHTGKTHRCSEIVYLVYRPIN